MGVNPWWFTQNVLKKLNCTEDVIQAVIDITFYDAQRIRNMIEDNNLFENFTDRKNFKNGFTNKFYYLRLPKNERLKALKNSDDAGADYRAFVRKDTDHLRDNDEYFKSNLGFSRGAKSILLKEKEKNEVAQPAQPVVKSKQEQPLSDTKKTTDKEAIQQDFLVMLKEKAERIVAISKKNVDKLSSEDKILISTDEQYTLALYALTSHEIMGSRVHSENEVENIRKNIAEKQNRIMNDDLYEKKEVVGNKNNEKDIADILNQDWKDLTEDDKELIMGLKDNLFKNTLFASSVLGNKTPEELKEIQKKFSEKVYHINISELQKKEQTSTVSSTTIKPGKQEVQKSN